MTDRPLRFSERKRLSETGSLGDLRDDVPAELRNAVNLYLHYAGQGVDKTVRDEFDTAVSAALGRHFGDHQLLQALGRPSTEDFLDAIEIIVEEGAVPRKYKVYRPRFGYETRTAAYLPTGERDLNELFDRHRLAFTIDNGHVRAISSPLLDAEIVGPALLTSARTGWEQVERSYREAVLHQRRVAEWRESLTAASAAVEAALKATGYKGATLGDLAKDFRRSPAAAGYSPAIAQDLTDLLSQLMAWRSHEGSAHGKPPGSDDPPPELVALAIHWAGAFIAYLGAIH
jgi:hypothetical protein